MTKRLLALLNNVPMNGIGMIDVGTDHAIIPISLAQKGYQGKLFASDIHQGPLQKAKNAAEDAGVAERISFQLCDGLALCPATEIDCIVIAGMGGETICRILDQAEWIFDGLYHFVFQPMTHAEVLRYWLVHNEFQIIREEIVPENGQLFQLFTASLGKSLRYSDPEYIVGKLNGLRSGVSVYELLKEEGDLLRKKVSGLSESKRYNSEYAFYRKILTEMEMLMQNEYGK